MGALAAVGLSLPQYARAASEGKVRPGCEKRSCIMIFNLGGPSNMDLWDMKPDAPAEIRGPFKPIRTKSDAFEISELLPKHADVADKFSLVRSCHHDGAAVHDAGWQIMQTGRRFTGGIQTPHAGSVASLSPRAPHRPAAVRRAARSSWAAAAATFPTARRAASSARPTIPSPSWPTRRSPTSACPISCPPTRSRVARLDRRRKMREIVEGAATQFEASEDARLLDENFHAAYRLMTSPQAREAFDLSKEPQAVRERYGMNRFGQCCLLARRLVENGVRFVTINTFLTVFDEITWDIHGSKPFTSIEGMKNIVCPMYDQAYSAPHRRPRPARPPRRHARGGPGGIWPHAEGEPRRRPRPLAAVLHRARSPAAA